MSGHWEAIGTGELPCGELASMAAESAVWALYQNSSQPELHEFSEVIYCSRRVSQSVSVCSLGRFQGQSAVSQTLHSHQYTQLSSQPTHTSDPVKRRMIRDTTYALYRMINRINPGGWLACALTLVVERITELVLQYIGSTSVLNSQLTDRQPFIDLSK